MDSTDSLPSPLPPPTRKKKRTVWLILLGIFALLVVVAREGFIYTASLATVAASITTAEVLQVDEDIELPVAKEKRKTEAAKTGEYSLNMKWENERSVFGFLGKDYEEEEAVISELKKLKKSVPDCRLIIRGDQRLPAIEIQRAMKILSGAGFDTITFSALDQK